VSATPTLNFLASTADGAVTAEVELRGAGAEGAKFCDPTVSNDSKGARMHGCTDGEVRVDTRTSRHRRRSGSSSGTTMTSFFVSQQGCAREC
jgi:hypothetical protein